MPDPPHSLHVLLRRWCWQMLAPPHSLHWFLIRWCGQIPAPPHSLQSLLRRWCWHSLPRSVFCLSPPSVPSAAAPGPPSRDRLAARPVPAAPPAARLPPARLPPAPRPGAVCASIRPTETAGTRTATAICKFVDGTRPSRGSRGRQRGPARLWSNPRNTNQNPTRPPPEGCAEGDIAENLRARRPVSCCFPSAFSPLLPGVPSPKHARLRHAAATASGRV